MKAQSGVALGVIAFQNLATHQARQKSGSTLAAMPADSITRLEMYLDVQRAAVETSTQTNEDRLDRKIRMQ